MNPPLRESSDTAACLEGLLDGTIDCFASDHAPHTEEEKSLEFSEAPNGMIGLESSIGVTLTKLVATKKVPLKRYVEAWTSGPARVMGLPGGSIKVGGPADLTLLDLNRKWTLDPAVFQSKGRNCPFKGWKLKGAPVWTVVNGKAFKAIGQTMSTD
jgi:dihydroorotase